MWQIMWNAFHANTIQNLILIFTAGAVHDRARHNARGVGAGQETESCQRHPPLQEAQVRRGQRQDGAGREKAERREPGQFR